MLGFYFFSLSREPLATGRKYNAGGTKRVRADHVGGHSNVVARDQPKQQRGRYSGGQTKNHIDRSLHATTIAWSSNDPSIVRNNPPFRSLGVTDAPHSQTKLSGGKKSAGAAAKRAVDQYLFGPPDCARDWLLQSAAMIRAATARFFIGQMPH
jgi:hypothetical protein